MRRASRFRRMGLILLIMGVPAACRNDSSPPDAGGEPAPVAGDRASAPGRATGSAPSANPLGGCAICHTDVVDAFAGSKHRAQGTTCEDCHGLSLAHIDDENNDVKPDRTFAPHEIDSFCSKCHSCSRPGARAALTAPAEPPKTCTECHGAHKIVVPAP